VRSRGWLLVILGAGIVGIGLLWKYTPLADVIQPAKLAARLEGFGHTSWGPVAMLALYLIGGFVMMPLLALLAATALIFEPVTAIAVALTGALLNASAVYFVGAKLLREWVERSFGQPIARVRKALQSRGVLAVAMVRMVPVAPFTLVNIAAGSIGVPFREYLFGTFLGLAPGTVLICVFGQELKDLMRDPSPGRILIVVAIAAAWILLSLGIQRFVSRRQRVDVTVHAAEKDRVAGDGRG
jgi:phospholipase D1/2